MSLPADGDEEEELPEIGDAAAELGLEVRQAQNLLIVLTTMGGAQPVASIAGLRRVARGRRYDRRRQHSADHLPGQSPRRKAAQGAHGERSLPNSSSNSPRVAVAGVSGYAGAELARILLHHPRLSTAPVFLGREGAEETLASDRHPSRS